MWSCAHVISKKKVNLSQNAQTSKGHLAAAIDVAVDLHVCGSKNIGLTSITWEGTKTYY